MIRIRRILLWSIATWAVASLVLGSDAGISVAAMLLTAYGAGLLLFAWLILLVSAVVGKQQMVRWWLEPVATLAVLSAIYFGIPFYVRFVLSKPFLDRYVSQTSARGISHRQATRVGLFVARETEVLPIGVRIITTSCMFDECGLAYTPDSNPPVIGEDSYIHIGGDWWRWWRSW